MSVQWSEWISSPEYGWYREWTVSDDVVYYQYEDEGDTVRDYDYQPVMPHLVSILGITLDNTPRNVPDDHSSQPLGQAEASLQGLDLNYPHTTAANDDDDESYGEGDDDLTDLPDLPDVILSEETMRDKRIETAEEAELLSVRTAWTLPDKYTVKPTNFFTIGKVFRVLYVEATGTTSARYEGDASVYRSLRPVIVVKRRHGRSTCVPIFSHGGQGVGKKGLNKEDVIHHAVVHMHHRLPRFVAAEAAWVQSKTIKLEDSITVQPTFGATFSPSSRIRFDMPYEVHHNLKVAEVGVVVHKHRETLVRRWRDANR